MPYLTVYTNVESKNLSQITEDASHLTAQILHKPEGYVVANIVHNAAMCFGGSAQNKGALVELKSIGLGDKDKFVAELTAFLAERLGISNSQYIAISLVDMPMAYAACNGQTFG
mgnify:CR=1 FL=1